MPVDSKYLIVQAMDVRNGKALQEKLDSGETKDQSKQVFMNMTYSELLSFFFGESSS